MKIKFTLVLVFLFFQNSFSQTIRDSIFNDVILIKNENVIKKDNDFLINIPLKISKNPIVIYNADDRIPNIYFFDRKSFLEKQDKIILIKPDWDYYKGIRESEKRTGLHLKPVRQSKIYQIDRNSKRIDSLTIREDDPWKPIIFNFKKTEIKTKKIRGFVFEDYMIPAQMEVGIKGTDIKTQTDADGKFTMEANEGDVLLISAFGERTIEITITEKNCYQTYLYRDTGLIYSTKKVHRERNKTRRKAIRKSKQGFYDCND